MDVLDKINKSFGEGTIMTLGEKAKQKFDATSTGSLEIDRISGIGGIPEGVIIEVFGNYASGKTTFCMQLCAQAQKEGKKVAWVDVEHAFQHQYARDLDLDLDSVAFSQPPHAEAAMAIIEMLCDSSEFDVIVLDSTGALVCKAEIEGDMGDAHIGLVPRLMAQAMRKLNGTLADNKCTLLCISQLRANINVQGYGPKTETTGGNALKFFSSMRLDMRNIGQIKQGEERIGHKLKISFTKNRFAAPFQECVTQLIYGHGVCKYIELIDIAVKADIIKQGGAWLTYEEEKHQGKFKFKKMLEEKPEIFEDIKALITGGDHVE